jgi:hypothetical protein
VELECRFVYDVQQGTLLHLDIVDNSGTSPASHAELWDLEDSLNNANPDAIARPQEWGLTVSTKLPGWCERN